MKDGRACNNKTWLPRYHPSRRQGNGGSRSTACSVSTGSEREIGSRSMGLVSSAAGRNGSFFHVPPSDLLLPLPATPPEEDGLDPREKSARTEAGVRHERSLLVDIDEPEPEPPPPLTTTSTTSQARKGAGMTDQKVAQLGPGAACCGWNHCGRRLAAGAVDGSVSVYDSQPSPSSKWQAHEHAILAVVWLPPDYGDAIACVCADGTLSLWEEIAEDDQLPIWRKCKVFEGGSSHILNVQFGLLLSSLKMVAAYSDGQVKVYELLDSLELDKWQLQAELQNITDPFSRTGKPACVSASIAWSPRRGEGQQASFAIGFNSDSPNFNSCKIWEFEEAHQRWLPLVELGSPVDKGERVHAVAWAPNIGRPYEIIAVATCKGIALWHVGFNPESDGRLSTENVAVLPGHNGEVWQLEWDMGGMTLASTGVDGMVKLWQANLNGVWHEQAVLDCNGSHD